MEVFLRSKHFKKTSPGVPHCYVMVVRCVGVISIKCVCVCACVRACVCVCV